MTVTFTQCFSQQNYWILLVGNDHRNTALARYFVCVYEVCDGYMLFNLSDALVYVFDAL